MTCDNLAYQFACALEPLADQLESAYCAFNTVLTDARDRAKS